MKKYFYSIVSFCLFFTLKGQVGIGTTTPSNTAVLELNSTNKGLLLNTVALTSTTASSPFTSHIEGMWVYNTVSAGTSPNNVIPGLYYNNGTKWIMMSFGTELPRIGDIKSSTLAADHNGWYLLNGRNISTLPATVQTNASSIGLVTQIPNSNDRIIKGKNTSEAFAATGGANSYVLTQANLPSLSLNGTTNTTGSHSHGYTNNGNASWNYNAGPLPATLFVNPLEIRQTNPAGDHNHTLSVSSGGSSSPVSQYPKNLVVQYFIYLGK